MKTCLEPRFPKNEAQLYIHPRHSFAMSTHAWIKPPLLIFLSFCLLKMLPFRGATAPCRYALKTSLSGFLFSRHLFNCILKGGERYVSGSLSPAGIREDVGHRRWVPLQKDGRGRELHERAAKGSVDHCTATLVCLRRFYPSGNINVMKRPNHHEEGSLPIKFAAPPLMPKVRVRQYLPNLHLNQ